MFSKLPRELYYDGFSARFSVVEHVKVRLVFLYVLVIILERLARLVYNKLQITKIHHD